ncbi:pilus assembly PilX family protein [Pseudomonas sp. CGJS7]|uniref:pilus assembly PilX family protein n=1 Tax=Pseudomonas sp. CGJS7 TaxID=3109348 RepID=UPI00300A0817
MTQNANQRHRRQGRAAVRTQRGAALFVALIMLILMALIGVAALQVTALVERMSFNYSASQLAFENAEARARGREADLDRQFKSNGTELIQVDTSYCQQAFSADTWAEGKNFVSPPSEKLSSYTRRIDQCISGYSSIKLGEAENKSPSPVFQITAYATDKSGTANSDAVIDTIFIP